MPNNKYIVHVDMDAFFASVEQRDNPKLRGLPVIIGSDPKEGKGRGVVSTCSYEARKSGIHSAMPISIAYRKCPKAIFLPPDIKKYSKISEQIYDIFYSFSPVIEMVGIDEAFLDITQSFHIFKTPLETCRKIQTKIKEELNLPASVGLAPTKIVAKIASDFDKPNGLVEVKSEDVKSFLYPLDLGVIWGLGKKTKIAFNNLSILTVGDLASVSDKKLIEAFGVNSLGFKKLANGIDTRIVESEISAKSISNEVTFKEDTTKNEILDSTMVFLCEKVSSRLRACDFKAKSLAVKIRLSDFSTFTRSISLTKSTNFDEIVLYHIKNLYTKFNKEGKAVRLIGVKASNLIEADANDYIFVDKKDKKRKSLCSAVDEIRGRFGDSSICRARVKT